MKKLSILIVCAILMSALMLPPLSGKNFPPGIEEICLSVGEEKLYNLINEHRANHGLKSIPLSISLTLVAKIHAADLFYNNPDDGQLCNMHSWSDQGEWEACCYTADHAKAECMWNKPGEITNYPGYGYEIAFWMAPVTDEVLMAEEAIKGWKQSPGHNNTIINAGVFQQAEWNAIGVGIYKNFIMVWFGEEPDEEGKPIKCES